MAIEIMSSLIKNGDFPYKSPFFLCFFMIFPSFFLCLPEGILHIYGDPSSLGSLGELENHRQPRKNVPPRPCWKSPAAGAGASGITVFDERQIFVL